MRILVAVMINDRLAGISAPQVGVPLRVLAIQCPMEVLKKHYTPQEIAGQQIKELPPQVRPHFSK